MIWSSSLIKEIMLNLDLIKKNLVKNMNIEN